MRVVRSLIDHKFSPSELKRPEANNPKSEVVSDLSRNFTEVAIYLVQADLSKLALEKRQIPLELSLNASDKIMALIREMEIAAVEVEVKAEGSQTQKGTLSPISKDAELKRAFIDRNGTAYLDFSVFSVGDSNGLSGLSGLSGGIAAELRFVESIIRTIQENVAQVKKVQLLIDGNEVQTVSSHIDLSKPLSLSQIEGK